MVLETLEEGSCHHPIGLITNPVKKTAFEYQGENGTVSANILRMDARFAGLLRWLGEHRITVRLSGENTAGRVCGLPNPRDRVLAAATRSSLQKTDFCSL